MNKSVGVGSVVGLIAISSAAQHSAWLPESKRVVVTPSYLFQTFDKYWEGNEKKNLGGDLHQHIASLGVDYGLFDNTALDLSVGWVWSEADGVFGSSHDNGLTDTTFGLRQRFVDETTLNLWWLPSLAVRLGGFIEGSYDENFPFPVGDGAPGAEASLLAGKSIWEGFGLYGDVGYRWREGQVPDEWFGSSGIFVSWKFLSATVGYRFFEGLTGNDIGNRGFRFSTVKEISQSLEASIGFTDPGGRHYQLFYAHTIDGRNTGQRDVFGGAVNLTF